jgi:hypothetical protein
MVLVRDPLEIRAEGEIPGRAQITDERVKPFDVGIALEDALKLSEQGLLAVIGEKACGHVRYSSWGSRFAWRPVWQPPSSLMPEVLDKQGITCGDDWRNTWNLQQNSGGPSTEGVAFPTSATVDGHGFPVHPRS